MSSSHWSKGDLLAKRYVLFLGRRAQRERERNRRGDESVVTRNRLENNQRALKREAEEEWSAHRQ